MSDARFSFKAFCEVLERISGTKKRLEIQDILSQYFKTIEDEQEALTAVCYLSTCTFCPEFHGKELGIGETTLVKVVSEITNKPLASVRNIYKKTGDLSEIAAKFRHKSLIPQIMDLSVISVRAHLNEISNVAGSNSLAVKMRKMTSCCMKCTPLEVKYLLRLYDGKMKIGLALKTLLISLSIVFYPDDPDMIEKVKAAYNRCPVFEDIVAALISKKNIENYIKIRPGVPVKPMLAQASKNLTCAFKKVENNPFTCEFKYDGERAQIHFLPNKTVKIFSRNSEDLTPKYPDLVETIKTAENNTKPYVLDAEIVAFDKQKSAILPFQVLTTRKRKDVDVQKISIQVCIYVFDCLFHDNESLLDQNLSFRRQILNENFIFQSGSFNLVNYQDSNTIDHIDDFFTEALKQNAEGVMIKNLDGLYKPSMRSTNWIKLKKDYLEGMSDTLDLVVIGAYYGKGKRTGTFGGFLLACYDDENDIYEAICKLGTGFDDEMLASTYKKITENNLIVEKYTLNNVLASENVKPDVWISPEIVWEVKAAGLSLSPIYSAAHRFNKSGISLRFPRFIKDRSDKNSTDATSSRQVNRMMNEVEQDVDDSDDLN